MGRDVLQKYKNVLFPVFDKFFNKIEIVSDYDYAFDFNHVDRKTFGHATFYKNHWGNFFIDDCELYDEIYGFTILLSIENEVFENILMEYLNNRYREEFGTQPVRKITDNCWR